MNEAQCTSATRAVSIVDQEPVKALAEAARRLGDPKSTVAKRLGQHDISLVFSTRRHKYLVHVSSQSEAERWAAKDPLVVEKVFQARVVAWHLVGIAATPIDPTFSA